MTTTPAQRAAIQQFTAFTSASEKTAIKFLKQHKWSVEIAVDSFYSSGAAAAEQQTSSSGRTSATGNLNALFDKYRDQTDGPDQITVNGVIRYFQDLELDLEDPLGFALAEMLKAPAMGELGRQGFVDGWRAKGADTIQKQQAELKNLRTAFNNDPETFKRVYTYAYSYSLTPPARTLNLDIAVISWRALFHKNHPFYPYLDMWIEFVETEYKKAISRDTWNMLLEFAAWLQGEGENGVKNYDIYGAWPSIIDSFVEFINKKQGNDKMETDDWNY